MHLPLTTTSTIAAVLYTSSTPSLLFNKRNFDHPHLTSATAHPAYHGYGQPQPVPDHPIPARREAITTTLDTYNEAPTYVSTLYTSTIPGNDLHGRAPSATHHVPLEDLEVREPSPRPLPVRAAGGPKLISSMGPVVTPMPGVHPSIPPHHIEDEGSLTGLEKGNGSEEANGEGGVIPLEIE